MTGARGSTLVRFAAFALLAVVAPAVILAVLGYHSLRQWHRSADALFREQARSMAVMVAEKVDLALRHAEYGVMGRLEAGTRSGAVADDALDALIKDTPLIARLALFDASGRMVYPSAGAPGFQLTGALGDLARVVWVQGGKAHRVVGDELVVGCLVGGGGRPAFLALLVLDPEVLRRDVLEPTLGGPEALAPHGHRSPRPPVYRRTGAERPEVVAEVPLSEVLPAWRLALYQPAGLSPRAAVDRQVMLFTVAFGSSWS